jgi:hypothetical protein
MPRMQKEQAPCAAAAAEQQPAGPDEDALCEDVMEGGRLSAILPRCGSAIESKTRLVHCTTPPLCQHHLCMLQHAVGHAGSSSKTMLRSSPGYCRCMCASSRCQHRRQRALRWTSQAGVCCVHHGAHHTHTHARETAINQPPHRHTTPAVVAGVHPASDSSGGVCGIGNTTARLCVTHSSAWRQLAAPGMM